MFTGVHIYCWQVLRARKDMTIFGCRMSAASELEALRYGNKYYFFWIWQRLIALVLHWRFRIFSGGRVINGLPICCSARYEIFCKIPGILWQVDIFRNRASQSDCECVYHYSKRPEHVLLVAIFRNKTSQRDGLSVDHFCIPGNIWLVDILSIQLPLHFLSLFSNALPVLYGR